MLFGSGSMQGIHRRWFAEKLERDGVMLEDLTERWAGLMVCGPNAAAILGEAAAEGPKSVELPFLHIRRADLCAAPEAVVACLSFTGESGFEIYTPMAYHRSLFQDLLRRGADHGLRPAGGRALMELRLEKSFPAWGLDLTSDYGPAETGLSRFIDWNKSDFIGREAALAAREKGPGEVLTTLVVEAEDADCAGGEPVFQFGEYVGYVSSGGFGHVVNESLALAYLPPRVISDGAAFEVEILGQRRTARLSTSPRFDAQGKRMRGQGAGRQRQ
jgi:dimethylglycine dehydrogenase